MERDRDIVDSVELVVATPKDNKEELRSGTWYTVRQAYQRKKPVKLIWPEGQIEDYEDYKYRINDCEFKES